jgi:hypothetical protein
MSSTKIIVPGATVPHAKSGKQLAVGTLTDLFVVQLSICAASNTKSDAVFDELKLFTSSCIDI